MNDGAPRDTSGSHFADIARFRRVNPDDAGLHYGERAIQRCRAATEAAESFLSQHERSRTRDTAAFLEATQFVQQQLAAARCLRDLMSTAFSLRAEGADSVPPVVREHTAMQERVTEQIRRLEAQHQRLLIEVAHLPPAPL